MMTGIDEAIAARGSGNVWATVQCYRCWVKYRRKNHTNITMHEGTAYCLGCVDELTEEQQSANAELVALLSASQARRERPFWRRRHAAS